MNLKQHLSELREVDWAGLDVEGIATWPVSLKFLFLCLLYLLIFAAGSYLHIDNLKAQLAVRVSEEATLRENYETNTNYVANLDAYRAQIAEMRVSFAELLTSLPLKTEVPGLLDDITEKGELNGLKINRIDLLEEQDREIYVEIPIAIEAVGSYHDLGAFVSGMAALPRIVTVHDFEIAYDSRIQPMLNIKILAKTYRYEGEGDGV
jgi:type IV pilus assembly protein PilO